jgi:hypothetical protein
VHAEASKSCSAEERGMICSWQSIACRHDQMTSPSNMNDRVHLCNCQDVQHALEGLPRDEQLRVAVSQAAFPAQHLRKCRGLLRCCWHCTHPRHTVTI